MPGHWSTTERSGNSKNSSWLKVNQAWNVPWLVHPPNMSSIRSLVCSKIRGNCPTNYRWGNSRNSVECDSKLIRPGQSHDELIHLFWIQYDQWYICKCVETVCQTTSRESASVQRSVIKSKSGLEFHRHCCVCVVWNTSDGCFKPCHTEIIFKIRIHFSAFSVV